MVCQNETCNDEMTTRTTRGIHGSKDFPMTTNMQQLQDEAAPQDMFERPQPAPKTTKRVVAFFGALAVSAAALAAVGIAPRAERGAELTVTQSAVAEARRVVNVTSPTRDGAAYALRLPGSTAPLQTTVLFARTDGYVKAFHVDIGDHVKAGQVLAEIENPQTDQQLREARATLERTRADLALAESRINRVKAAFTTRATSQGELDDVTAQNNAAVAAVRVNEAVVARLEQDQGYQKVVAAFDGVVTQRSVELGTLVTAGSGSNVTSLFRLEQSDVLKVFVDVPQTAAPSVVVGQAVVVEFRELPGRKFEGKVARTAGSVDPVTRTLRTEIHLPNPKGELMAGAYAQVSLPVHDPRNPLRIAASSLVIDAAGPQVVTVAADHTARRIAVTLGRDFGKEVEVTTGLQGAERLVVSPRDDLRDGDKVEIR